MTYDALPDDAPKGHQITVNVSADALAFLVTEAGIDLNDIELSIDRMIVLTTLTQRALTKGLKQMGMPR